MPCKISAAAIRTYSGQWTGEKPAIPGIDSRSNDRNAAPQTWHSGAISAHALEYPRNRVRRRENFTAREKKKF
jgi:hypothetical protein